MKTVIGYTGLTLIRTGMIGCIVKLTLLWEPVVTTGSLASVIGRAFIG